jgi:hypothetical protein
MKITKKNVWDIFLLLVAIILIAGACLRWETRARCMKSCAADGYDSGDGSYAGWPHLPTQYVCTCSHTEPHQLPTR